MDLFNNNLPMRYAHGTSYRIGSWCGWWNIEGYSCARIEWLCVFINSWYEDHVHTSTNCVFYINYKLVASTRFESELFLRKSLESVCQIDDFCILVIWSC